MSPGLLPVPHVSASAPPCAVSPAPSIGVFDSGVGGLSVLRAVRNRLPGARLLYVADSGHAPYGDRDPGFVLERSAAIGRFLVDQGAQLLVVACNTATAAAVAHLRAAWPAMPLVGVEPGLKPALRRSVTRRIGVLATTGTLSSEKFLRLVQSHAQDATLVLQPCPGLADAIEEQDDAGIAELVERYSAPLRAAEVDVAVLGCTHYPFVQAHFAAALPGVALIDTAEAVAEQTRRLAEGLPSTPCGNASLKLWTSGTPGSLQLFVRRWQLA